MPRWERTGTLVLVGAVATGAIDHLTGCHHPTYNEDYGDDDEGDGGPCQCEVTPGNTIPCGETLCTGGTDYLCSGGTPITVGYCGGSPGGDDGGGADGGGDDGGMVCIPECDGVSCGGSDMCGGICGCDVGVTCSPSGTCGNGCEQQAGSVCSDGGLTTCCQEGNLCKAGDAGVSTCCAQTTTTSFQGGICSFSTDCCDYPAVTCGAEGGSGTCQ
jgi:hypothetical protein